MKPGKTGIGRIVDAAGYSIAGLRATFQHEAAFRQECLLTLVLLPLVFVLGQNPVEWALLIGPLFMVLIVEVINSAIEAIVDLVSPEHHPLAGRAKDMGSAAVMLTLILLFLVWAFFIFQRLTV
ncbi:MAG: diacylglycerol kinase [Candidatus Polarisedimenticolaceae bacterium]|nr:diacylglycerol kinase [Candidatus Polarisedimenticolaceae bacterium]